MNDLVAWIEAQIAVCEKGKGRRGTIAIDPRLGAICAYQNVLDHLESPMDDEPELEHDGNPDGRRWKTWGLEGVM